MLITNSIFIYIIVFSNIGNSPTTAKTTTTPAKTTAKDVTTTVPPNTTPSGKNPILLLIFHFHPLILILVPRKQS